MPSCLNVSVVQKIAFAIGVRSNIVEFYLSTRNSINLKLTLELTLFFILQSYALFFIKKLLKPSTHPLRPYIVNNACPYRISAAAGTALARTSFLNICHYLFYRNGFTAN